MTASASVSTIPRTIIREVFILTALDEQQRCLQIRVLQNYLDWNEVQKVKKRMKASIKNKGYVPKFMTFHIYELSTQRNWGWPKLVDYEV